MPVWRPTDEPPHGVREFIQSTRLVIPEHTSTISVELWGGGGGGGGGSTETYTEGGAGGGGGASGAYARATITVTPGNTYTLIVGRGGKSGAGQKDRRATPGQDGGDSLVCDGDAILATARGGGGGGPARDNNHGGPGGRGRVAEDDGTATALTRAGHDGGSGLRPLFEYPGWGGKGGRPVAGSVAPSGAAGGAGGKGADRPDGAGDGEPGAAGSIIVSW